MLYSYSTWILFYFHSSTHIVASCCRGLEKDLFTWRQKSKDADYNEDDGLCYMYYLAIQLLIYIYTDTYMPLYSLTGYLYLLIHIDVDLPYNQILGNNIEKDEEI